jgi:protein-S-isoprenylcysteine O-methyltransferase Ste14
MALFIYFLLYFFLAFVWRAVVVYRQSGNNPFVLSAEDNVYGYVSRAFKVVILVIAFVVSLNAVNPGISAWLGPFLIFKNQSSQIGGWFLLITSFGWLLIAQVQMGNSWRIGIDSKNSTAMVSSGLFSVSRNPIFLAMRINLLGFFLVLPNTATLVVLVSGELLMQVQVRLEEIHLANLHGKQYAQYAARVRRWL